MINEIGLLSVIGMVKKYLVRLMKVTIQRMTVILKVIVLIEVVRRIVLS